MTKINEKKELKTKKQQSTQESEQTSMLHSTALRMHSFVEFLFFFNNYFYENVKLDFQFIHTCECVFNVGILTY